MCWRVRGWTHIWNRDSPDLTHQEKGEGEVVEKLHFRSRCEKVSFV